MEWGKGGEVTAERGRSKKQGETRRGKKRQGKIGRVGEETRRKGAQGRRFPRHRKCIDWLVPGHMTASSTPPSVYER